MKADIDHVVDVSRGTTIGINGVRVATVEHVLAAICGLGIDNVDIEVDADETPVGDGSAVPFMETLKEAGIVEQDAEREYIEIAQPVYCKSDDKTLSVLPADETRLTVTIAYDHVAVGTQYASYTITPESFETEIAPARTFCFLREVRMLQEQGLIKGGSLENAIVIGDESILNDDLRFPDEFVRHKILDLLGDLFLLGRPLKGHVIAVKSGHPLHVDFSKQVKKSLMNRQRPRHPRHDGRSPQGPAGLRRQHDHESAPAPLPIPAGRPHSLLRAPQACRGNQERYGKRALLPRTLAQYARDAGRPHYRDPWHR